jgi:hypothetical protein
MTREIYPDMWASTDDSLIIPYNGYIPTFNFDPNVYIISGEDGAVIIDGIDVKKHIIFQRIFDAVIFSSVVILAVNQFIIK